MISLSRTCLYVSPTEKQYLWRDPVFVDIYGAEFFPVQFTAQNKLVGLEGIGRSLDLVLRVRRKAINQIISRCSQPP